VSITGITSGSAGALHWHPAAKPSGPNDQGVTDSAQSRSSGSGASSGVTDPFRQLSADLQSILLQLQDTTSSVNKRDERGSGSPNDAGNATSSGGDAISNGGAPTGKLPQQATATDTSGASQLPTDLATLVSELNGGDSASGGTSSLPGSLTPSPPSGPPSAAYFNVQAALLAYSNTTAKS